MFPYFSQEILKQKWITVHLLNGPKTWDTQRDEASYYFK